MRFCSFINWSVRLACYSLAFPLISNAQSLMNLADGIHVVLSDSAQLVVSNSSDSALISSGSGAHIISEGEGNRVVWEIGTDTGTYSIPFGTTSVSEGGNGVAIPMTLKVSTAGSGSGELQFSTYETSNDDNTPRPSTASNTNNSSSNDVSLKMLDRYWVIQSSGYTTNPSGTLTMGYDDNSNEVGGSNSITEGYIHPMKWNSGSSYWETVTSGSHNFTTNLVSGIPVSGSDLNTFWTLMDNGNALPVSLENFRSICDGEVIQVNWTTASEINNNYFEICTGSSPLEIRECLTVAGQGTTNSRSTYKAKMPRIFSEPQYVQLRQVDYDGGQTLYPWYRVDDCNTNATASSELRLFPNPFNDRVFLDSSSDQLVEITVYNAIGQLVMQQKGSDKELDTSHLIPGTYTIDVRSDLSIKSFKMIKTEAP